MVELGLVCSENTINHALLSSVCLQRWDDFDAIKHTSLVLLEEQHVTNHLPSTTPHNSTTAPSSSSVVTTTANKTRDHYPRSTDFVSRKKLVPTSEAIYITLVKAAGARGNAVLAFRYLQDAIKTLNQVDNRPTRALFREVIQVTPLSCLSAYMYPL